MSTGSGWFYAKDGKSVGPMSLEQLLRELPAAGGQSAMVYGPGTSDWVEARHVEALRSATGGSSSAPPPPPRASRSDEIDYEIFGNEMQYVEVTLDPGETVVAEAG